MSTLATRINSHHAAAVLYARAALEHARAAGALLLEAKDSCKHGEWLPWLTVNFKGSEKTAQNYMRIARRWAYIVAAAKPQHVADLTVREALQLARYGYSRKTYRNEGRV